MTAGLFRVLDATESDVVMTRAGAPRNARPAPARAQGLRPRVRGAAAHDPIVGATAIGFRLFHALRKQAPRGLMVALGKYKAARIWELPPERTLV